MIPVAAPPGDDVCDSTVRIITQRFEPVWQTPVNFDRGPRVNTKVLRALGRTHDHRGHPLGLQRVAQLGDSLR